MLRLLIIRCLSLLTPNVIKNWYRIIWSVCLISFISLFSLIMSANFSISNHYIYNDSISLVLSCLSCWIVLLMFLARQPIYSNRNKSLSFRYVLMRLLILLLFAFSCSSLFSFYFFFEATLIPTLFLILGWGYQPERLQASVYFVLYTIGGSLPLLVIVFIQNDLSGSISIPLANLIRSPMFLSHSNWVTCLITFLIIMAFFIKLPMFRVHLWLPKAHVEAPVAGSMILAAILLKLGGYGVIRILQTFSPPTSVASIFIFCLRLWGGFMRCVICFRQVDLKALIAYSSIGHISLVIGGCLSCTEWGWKGALLIIISHGFCSSGLFTLANLSYEKSLSRSLIINKGILLLYPTISAWWFLFCAMNIAAPPSLNLLGELICIPSCIFFSFWCVLPIFLIRFLAALFNIYLYTSTQHGAVSCITHSYSKRGRLSNIILFLHWVPCNLLILKPVILIM